MPTPTPTSVPTYYNTAAARNALSELLRRVRHGERVVIAHAGHPVAELVPYDTDVELRPGLVRLSLLVHDVADDAGDVIPTRSSPAASTSRPARPG